jgi:hypothetical protein
MGIILTMQDVKRAGIPRKTRETLKDKFNELATNARNNIRDLYRGIN